MTMHDETSSDQDQALTLNFACETGPRQAQVLLPPLPRITTHRPDEADEADAATPE